MKLVVHKAEMATLMGVLPAGDPWLFKTASNRSITPKLTHWILLPDQLLGYLRDHFIKAGKFNRPSQKPKHAVANNKRLIFRISL